MPGTPQAEARFREYRIESETRTLRAFQRQADAISSLILDTDLPWIDIEIRIERLRRQAVRLFAGKDHVFALVYDSRFRRLWEQWRTAGEEGDHE